jgi:hypothetical protein
MFSHHERWSYAASDAIKSQAVRGSAKMPALCTADTGSLRTDRPPPTREFREPPGRRLVDRDAHHATDGAINQALIAASAPGRRYQLLRNCSDVPERMRTDADPSGLPPWSALPWVSAMYSPATSVGGLARRVGEDAELPAWTHADGMD